jgi:hypothetical protein
LGGGAETGDQLQCLNAMLRGVQHVVSRMVQLQVHCEPGFFIRLIRFICSWNTVAVSCTQFR